MRLLFALVISLTIAFSGFAQSQNYRAFKVDLATGYSSPSESGSNNGGLNLSLEPKFNITDNIAVGFKYEVAVLASASSGSTSVLGVVRSTSLTGEYYLGDRMVRPYVGAGLGLYKAYLFINSNGKSDLIADDETLFGFAPRAGLQVGHFRLGGEYNLVKNSNFFSLKLGVTLGGGQK